jgi:hypothetical protein
MSFVCYLCSTTFTKNYNLNKHLNDRCKTDMIHDLVKLNNYISDLHNQIKQSKQNIIIGDNSNNNTNSNNIVNNNTINLKLEININPISKLNTKYLNTDKMLQLLENFDKDKGNQDKLNLVLADYINNIICDPEHPENHVVKYIKKNPPTYNTITEDADGNKINVIKNLKNTCELLSDPVLNILKKKLGNFIKKYNKDDDPTVDWGMIEDAVIILREELKKNNVKKALKNVLRDDILNNIEMKLVNLN